QYFPRLHPVIPALTSQDAGWPRYTGKPGGPDGPQAGRLGKADVAPVACFAAVQIASIAARSASSLASPDASVAWAFVRAVPVAPPTASMSFCPAVASNDHVMTSLSAASRLREDSDSVTW